MGGFGDISTFAANFGATAMAVYNSIFWLRKGRRRKVVELLKWGASQVGWVLGSRQSGMPREFKIQLTAVVHRRTTFIQGFSILNWGMRIAQLEEYSYKSLTVFGLRRPYL